MSLADGGHIDINQYSTLIRLDLYLSQRGGGRNFLLILFKAVKDTAEELPCG